MTPKEFLLKKYPTHRFFDCPVPKRYWKDMQEFSDANNRQLAEQNKELLEVLSKVKSKFKGCKFTVSQDMELTYQIETAIKNAETIKK